MSYGDDQICEFKILVLECVAYEVTHNFTYAKPQANTVVS